MPAGLDERRIGRTGGRAQITWLGHGSDSQADDRAAVPYGGYRAYSRLTW